MSLLRKIFRKDAPLGVSPSSAWEELQDAMQKSAVEKQNEIRAWVERGGDVNWTCSKNMTLLHYAAMQGNLEMVEFLLANSARVNKWAKGRND